MYDTPAKLEQLRTVLKELTVEGERGRLWYERSGDAFIKFAGGDIKKAIDLAKIMATFSPGSRVNANTTFGLIAWAQHEAGLPINSGRFPVAHSAAAEAALRGEDWNSQKTKNFYINLLRAIDPKAADSQGVTVDMWVMRIMGFDVEKPSEAQYHFAEVEVNRIAKEMGWEPQQAQAAMWVAAKARWEPKAVTQAVDAASVKAGDFKWVTKNGKAERQFAGLDAEKRHLLRWRDHALKYEPTQEDMDFAVVDYSDFLERAKAQFSWEAVPSTKVPGFDWLHDNSEAKAELAARMRDVIGDRILRPLGLLQSDGQIGFGGWLGAVSPSAQEAVAVATVKKDGKQGNDHRVVIEHEREALDAAAALYGLLLKQDGVAWHRPYYDGAQKNANGMELRFGRPLSESETKALYDEVVKRGVTDYALSEGQAQELAPIPTPDGVRFLNFGTIEKNVDFHKLIVTATEAATADDVVTEAVRFRSDGNLVTDTDGGYIDGQGYRQGIGSSRFADLLGRLEHELRPEVDAVYADVERKYGGKRKRAGRPNASGDRRARGAPEAVGRAKARRPWHDREVQEGASQVSGRHYANTAGLKALDPTKYGTNHKGAESRRLDNAAWMDEKYEVLQNRVYFYPVGSKLYGGESMVGRAETHDLSFDNLYDQTADPRNLYERAEQLAEADGIDAESAFEYAVIEAGFDGYFHSEMGVLLDTKPVPVGKARARRTDATAAAFGRRIDEVFAIKDKRSLPQVGVRILDGTEQLALIGYPDKPLVLNERHIFTDAGSEAHPELAPADWKKLPAWLDNPVAIFESENHPGNLLFIAPEKVGGKYVAIAVSPKVDGDYLAVSVHPRQGVLPLSRWANAGLVRYVNTETAPEMWRYSTGRAMPPIPEMEGARHKKALAALAATPRKAGARGQGPRAESSAATERSSHVNRRGTGGAGNSLAGEVNLADSRILTQKQLGGARRGAGVERDGTDRRGDARARRYTRDGNRPDSYILIDGDKAFARVAPAVANRTKGFAAGPIVLKVGEHHENYAQGEAILSTGYGVAHIEERHGAEIRALGMSIEDFVADVANNWTHAYTQTDRDGRQRLVLTKMVDGAVRMQVLELRKEGSGREWSVVTAYTVPAREFRKEMTKGGRTLRQLSVTNENAGRATFPAQSGSTVGGTDVGSVAYSNTPGANESRSALPLRGAGEADAVVSASDSAQSSNNDSVSRTRARRAGQSGFTGYTLPTESFVAAYADAKGNWVRKTLAGLSAGARHARRRLQDDFLPMKQVQELIKAQGNYGEVMNTYQYAELFHGRTEDRLTRFNHEHVKPLMEALAKAGKDKGVTLDDLELYLYARFAPHRNRAIYEANRDRRDAHEWMDGKSGMTDKDAADILADFQGRGLTETLSKLAKRVYAINSARIDLLEGAGLLTADQAAEWRAEPDYVPLRGFADGRQLAFESKAGGASGKGFSISGRESMRAKGRNSRAADIVGNTIAMMETSILRAEKNRVAQSLLAMVYANPDPDLWEVAKPKVVAVRDRRTGELIEDSEGNAVVRRYYPSDREPAVMSAKIDGKEYMIYFKGENGERMAVALKNLGAHNLGQFLQVARSFNRWLSMARTTLSPEFVVTNFARDIQTAAANMGVEHSAKLAKQTLKGIKPAMAAMYRYERDPGANHSKTKWDRYVRDFLADGGKTGLATARDLDQIKRDLSREMKKSSHGWTRRSAQSMWEAFMAANGAVENSSRLAAYVAAREDGMSRKDAASIAKNLTVNFNRRGTAGPTINSLFVFANASIQGTHRFANFIAKNPAKAIKYWAIPYATLGFATATLNGILGGEDDDGEERWSKVPMYEKQRNLIVMMDEHRFKMALPYVYSLPFNIGQLTADVTQGRTKPMTGAMTLLSSIAGGIYPLGDPGEPLLAAMPTVATPFVEVGINQNFTGRAIRPEGGFGDDSPDSQKAWRYTPGIYKWAAETMNELTGGSNVRPGMLDVSPTTIEHLTRFMGGGIYTFLIDKPVAIAEAAAKGEAPAPNKIPFVGRVYGTQSVNQPSYDYHDFSAEAKMRAEEYEVMRERGLLGDMDKQERTRYGLTMQVEAQRKAAERQLRALRRTRNAADDSGQAERKEKAEESMLEVQGRFNRAYVDMMRKLDEPIR